METRVCDAIRLHNPSGRCSAPAFPTLHVLWPPLIPKHLTHGNQSLKPQLQLCWLMSHSNPSHHFNIKDKWHKLTQTGHLVGEPGVAGMKHRDACLQTALCGLSCATWPRAVVVSAACRHVGGGDWYRTVRTPHTDDVRGGGKLGYLGLPCRPAPVQMWCQGTTPAFSLQEQKGEHMGGNSSR